MSTISVSLPSDGTTADVGDYNTPITTIVNAINGGLDNSNIAAAAGIAGTKIADDAITDSKLIYGKLRQRQGNSATNWGSSGTTNYDYSATNTFIQAGAKVLNTNGADSAVTFPVAFNQVPLVVATTNTAGTANVYVLVNTVTATGFNLRTVSGNGTTETAAWIAIGE